MKRIDRRRFLQGTGVALSLPFLESISGRAHAGPGDGPPKRLVVFYCLQGHPFPSIRDPLGTPGNYQLNDVFQEPVDRNTGQIADNVANPNAITLADFKDQMTVVTGVNMQSAIDEGGNAHNLSAGHSLIGQTMLPGGNSNNETLASAASIDDLIASRITDPSVAFKALHVSSSPPWEICFTGPGEPVSRLSEPDQMAQMLFGDFTNPDQNLVAERKARRQSVLDATKDNIAYLRSRISVADRGRLDAYLERIQQIEQSLNAGISGESCSPIASFDLERSPFREFQIDPVPGFDPYYDPDIATPANIDAMVEALACDRTRVATITMPDHSAYFWLRYANAAQIHNQYPAGDPLYPHAGQSGNWHSDIVHANWPDQLGAEDMPPYSTAVTGEFLRRAARWEMSQFAYLLSRLQSKEESNGTLLDNTVVLYVNEFGSATHNHENMMYLVAGGGGGTLKQGQWLQYNGEPHNRLLLSLLRAFDINDVDTFGTAAYCSGGPLSGLLA